MKMDAPMMDRAESPMPMRGGSNSDRVPLSALAVPDEGEQMAPPEPGDKVQYTVEGTVESVEGDQAVVRREAINGEPVGKDEGRRTKDETGGGDDLAELERMAGGMTL